MRFSFCTINIFIVIVFLFGCTTSRQTHWQINTGDRSTLAFSGKGAAAGMMMDAYIGGAGIAIGIAIDEGIAKKIAENIEQSSKGLNIVAMVQAHLSHKYSNHYFFTPNSGNSAQVIIETYGFHTFPGEGDKATAWLKIRFARDGKDVVINYPADFDNPAAAELSDIKTNPELAYKMLDDAVAMVVARDGM